MNTNVLKALINIAKLHNFQISEIYKHSEGGNKITNNNQLVWKKEFTDSNRKQLKKGHTCSNIYFND